MCENFHGQYGRDVWLTDDDEWAAVDVFFEQLIIRIYIVNDGYNIAGNSSRFPYIE